MLRVRSCLPVLQLAVRIRFLNTLEQSARRKRNQGHQEEEAAGFKCGGNLTEVDEKFNKTFVILWGRTYFSSVVGLNSPGLCLRL